MRKILFLSGILMCAGSLSSCYYDNLATLYPKSHSECDTSQVRFSGTIASLLQNNCLSCHSNSIAPSFGGGIRLQDYADVSANAGRALGAIRHLPGYSAMPKNGGMLDSCSIIQFEVWVRNGKPDN